MVEVVQFPETAHIHMGGGHPLVHVHSVVRRVHGNEISIHVKGEMKIAAKEVVFARELKLNTIQVLLLTPESAMAEGAHYNYYLAQKWIHHKGEYDNYASVNVFRGTDDADATQMDAGNAHAPADGSIWLNFEAVGE